MMRYGRKTILANAVSIDDIRVMMVMVMVNSHCLVLGKLVLMFDL